jgi:hypothetical protein
MSYNIHTNNATRPTQNKYFMQKNVYETLETLTLNITSNTHLNNKKLKQWHGFNFRSQTLKEKWNQNLPQRDICIHNSDWHSWCQHCPSLLSKIIAMGMLTSAWPIATALMGRWRRGPLAATVKWANLGPLLVWNGVMWLLCLFVVVRNKNHTFFYTRLWGRWGDLGWRWECRKKGDGPHL